MATRLKKPVARLVPEAVIDRGLRDAIVTLTGGGVTIRLKGTRNDWADSNVYTLEVGSGYRDHAKLTEPK